MECHPDHRRNFLNKTAKIGDTPPTAEHIFTMLGEKEGILPSDFLETIPSTVAPEYQAAYTYMEYLKMSLNKGQWLGYDALTV